MVDLLDHSFVVTWAVDVEYNPDSAVFLCLSFLPVHGSINMSPRRHLQSDGYNHSFSTGCPFFLPLALCTALPNEIESFSRLLGAGVFCLHGIVLVKDEVEGASSCQSTIEFIVVGCRYEACLCTRRRSRHDG